jgi:hypothetical protein
MEKARQSISEVSRLVVVALIASLLVLVAPFQAPSKADYIDSNLGPIVYNDRVCNLGDPNDHSTSATAFEISTSDQLWEITDCVSNSATIYFELGDNIDVSQASTASTNSPIGYSTSSIAYSFSGVLDGNGHEISGISMSASNYGVGLFAYLHNASISNLVISGELETTTQNYFNQDAAGALAIRSSGTLTLTGITNHSTVSGLAKVGGLVGYVENALLVMSSSNYGTVSGSDGRVGGLVGEVNGDSSVINSYNAGSISGSGDVGGLLGDAGSTANVLNSSNTGTVTGSGDDVGGLLGYVYDFANITSSHNTGTVSGVRNIGGLIGFVDEYDAIIFDSYNNGSVTGLNDVGGLVGEVDGDSSVMNSYNSGPISGSGSVGGLLGDVGGTANVLNSSNTGSITGSGAYGDYVGGLLGIVSQFANITSSHNTGAVSGQDATGGLIGQVYSEDANIFDSYNTGSVTGTGNYVGGLIGQVREETSNIFDSYNTGSVTGTANQVGGLVGYTGNANISSSYNSAAIFGSTGIGGLIGLVEKSELNIFSSYNSGNVTGLIEGVGGLVGDGPNVVTITFSYNIGEVTGGRRVGGLVGVGATMSIASSYNTGPVSGTTDVDGLVGAALNGLADGTVSATTVLTSVASRFAPISTVAEMKLASTYAGLEFDDVWGFGACTDNQGFPVLRTFATVGTYYAYSCGLNSAVAETTAPAPVYSGPILHSPQSMTAGQEVTYTGRRLSSVTSAYVGTTQLTVVSTADELLVLGVPESMAPGVYDLVLESSFGTLTFQQGLTVIANQAVVVPENAETSVDSPILTAGSFKGYVAIYTKGYEGQRLSAKVAGKWLVVEELKESWKTFDYSRTVRFTGAGYAITVDLYIDREFVKSVELVTK